MKFNFPTICAQSVRHAYSGTSLPVMAEFEAEVPSKILGRNGKPIMERKVVRTEWVDFNSAVQFQMFMNSKEGRHDSRFE